MATQTYSTPGSYTFTLPISTNITVKIAGAAGGSGGIDACSGGAPNVSGGTGGNGRYAEFTLPNYTYGSLTLVVGGPGGDGKNVGQTAFAGGSGGYNGGGTGGDDRTGGSSGGGGGGGGYSYISLGDTVLAVAGGGGGGGGASLCNYSGPNSSGYSYNGGNATTFISTNSDFSASNGGNGVGGDLGGDGGGSGGGGGGASGGNAGAFAGNDQQGGAAQANRADGGLGGGSKYRSDILTLSSQSEEVYEASTNGFIEIEYTEAIFDQSAAGISTAGPYYATGEIKFSDIRRDFRAQQRKTSGSGSEDFPADNGSVSASGFLRTVSTDEADPIVPNCQENNKISTGNDWKLSQFRNSIKFYYLTQDSSKTSLNYQIHGQPWNGNLTYNIVKTMFIEGTCGSVGVTTAAAVFDAQSYNLHVHVLGSLYGAGGSGGTVSDGRNGENGGDGGNGGDALYINTNNTGIVKVKTIGSSSKVYGGGAGGGAGGNGGKGGDGSYPQSYSYEQSLGGSGRKNISGSQAYYDMCHNACRDAFGGSAYCKPNCYILPWQGGCGCSCFSYQQGNQAECTCCYRRVSGTNTIPTNGGAGGAGGAGGDGRGYLQINTSGSPAPTLGQTDGPTSGGTNAGRGNDGGAGGNGGDWGQGGTDYDGEDGDPGEDGNVTNGEDGGAGGNAGTAGRAVAGSGYIIDSDSVAGAYIGLK